MSVYKIDFIKSSFLPTLRADLCDRIFASREEPVQTQHIALHQTLTPDEHFGPKASEG